ncbi:MAG: thioesterase [Rhodanobacter sp.]|jgi:thioesterase domain-containing protein|uniref:Thioesterase n=1 Tax=Rhodanobacter glycinis TaxID=582702 RepID=A0A5B9E5T9_9GAMM|nr:YiiD C-terminal domain-containing protein [Rhodanobacter glycinis]QEE26010.1 thioesterase [Rhodanobacter glycinis]TAM33827.1 MAG: thioesterase [Rhodanobacter sp.]
MVSTAPSPTDRHEAAQALVDFIHEGIPLARDMALQLHHYDGEQLTLAAPLAPNVNDKGCAFGGSLVSVMTLTGWGLVELALRARNEDCDVFVGESTVRYLSPVWDDFLSAAQLAPEADWTTFFGTLAARGKARIEVTCAVPGDEGKPAATLSARFVAKRRAHPRTDAASANAAK